MAIIKYKSGNSWIEIPTIKGSQGDVGNGISSAVLNNDYTLTLTFTNGQTYTTPSLRGQIGPTPVITSTKSGKITTILCDGSPVATIADGEDGHSPIITTSKSGKVTTIYADSVSIGTVLDGADAVLPDFLHICTSGEYDTTTRVPTIQNPSANTLYLVPNENAESGDLFSEWVYVNNAWELTGSARIDLSDYVKKTDYATANDAGVVKLGTGVFLDNERLTLAAAPEYIIKGGTNLYAPITTSNQHQSVFYGLAKAAGDTTQSQSSNAIGTYTDDAKSAIQIMLGVPSTDDIPEVPVQDVQINGTSVLSEGVANVPVASASEYGVVKINVGSTGLGLNSSGVLNLAKATEAQIKAGTNFILPFTVSYQHIATFYGLAKASGDTTQSQSSNAVGTYTDEAKGSIQHMLGTDNLAPYESDITADQAYAVGELFMLHGKLHRATAAINALDVFTVGTNCEVVNASDVFARDVQVNGTSVLSNGVANIPPSTTSRFGVVQLGNGFNSPTQGIINVDMASADNVKAGASQYKSISPYQQHRSVFYGLAKASGDTTQSSSSNAVGVYTDEAKSSIKSMLSIMESGIEATDPNMDGNVVINTTANLSDDYVKKTDYAVANSSAGIVKTYSTSGISINNDHQLFIVKAEDAAVKGGVHNYLPIVPSQQHMATFYGLAKAAGADMASSSNAVGTYTDEAKTAIRSMLGAVGDVQVNGTSVVSNGTANIPIATDSVFGVSKFGSAYGIAINASGQAYVAQALEAQIKAGVSSYRAIAPERQHISTFYGLAKAAGADMASSDNAVGTYTESAKSAIRSMLGMSSSIIGPYEETVSGSTPTIIGQPNYRYICGEVTSISITPPATGTIDVIFTSGSTVAVMTLPNTVKFPEWFDASTLEANTIYEIVITNGTYGGVMTWTL